MKNIRYQHCPQMRIYDNIGYQWVQNLMFMNTPNYRSKICSTDIFGLRFNCNPDKLNFEFSMGQPQNEILEGLRHCFIESFCSIT